jgi:hypothetical protein
MITREFEIHREFGERPGSIDYRHLDDLLRLMQNEAWGMTQWEHPGNSATW